MDYFAVENALVPVTSEVIVGRLADSAREYVRRSKAPRTIKADRSDWDHFVDFAVAGI